MKKHIERVKNNEKASFVVVGVMNTAIDFIVLNVFAHVIGLPRVPSNVISSSVAMVFSFVANKKVVFKSEATNSRRQAVLFLVVTVFSLYVIQNLIIHFLTEWWPEPLLSIHGVIGVLEEDVFMTNAAKLIATGASLVWNFLLYKSVVFKDE